MTDTFKKIIYFDDSSAIDLLQIVRKGNFNKTIELVNEVSGNVTGNVSIDAETGKQSALKYMFEKLSGFSGGIQAGISASGGLKGEKIARTLLENTLLGDFIDTVEDKDVIEIATGYKLSIDKNSMTYYAMISPITEMMQGQHNIDDESDITMSISKLNSGIRNIKGYFELVGKKNKDVENELDIKIFRFNIESFKNNYRIQDLRKMNLTLYSIYVGDTEIAELNFETEFDLNVDSTELEFEGFDNEIQSQTKEQIEKKVPVYDVILAGVK